MIIMLVSRLLNGRRAWINTPDSHIHNAYIAGENNRTIRSVMRHSRTSNATSSSNLIKKWYAVTVRMVARKIPRGHMGVMKVGRPSNPSTIPTAPKNTRCVTRYHIALSALIVLVLATFISFSAQAGAPITTTTPANETITLTLKPISAANTTTGTAVTTAGACTITVYTTKTVYAMVYTYTTEVVVPIGRITTWRTTFTFPINVTTIRQEWVIPPTPYWLLALAIIGFIMIMLAIILSGRREEGYV